MIIDVVMPKMGESITEGTILEWRKKVGDDVSLDEILLEIGTDKVDSEIPSSASGVVVEILANPNEVVEVGRVIARIDSSEKRVDNQTKSAGEKKIKPDHNIEYQESKLSPIVEDDLNQNENINNKTFFTPIVSKIAVENKISLKEMEMITGTGRGGRITKKDILLYLKTKSTKVTPYHSESEKKVSGQSSRVEEMHHMRKMISKHMMQSISTSAHVYVMTEVDMTSIVDFVNKESNNFNTNEGYPLTYTPFIISSVVRALKDHPEMNSSISNDMINYHKNINIGLAVSVEDGLMVPVLKKCEEKNFLGICRLINTTARRTREGVIGPEELSGSTFTVSNFGVFGVSMGTPIINQPNVGVLGVGAVKKQPVVIEVSGSDSIAIRSMMILTLGFDHRLIDGAGGSKFVESVKKNIQNLEIEDLL